MELRDLRTTDLTPDELEDERPFAVRTRALLTGDAAVPPVVSPPAGHPRFPLVDGVRAIAALAVVVTHAWYTSDASNTAWYGPFAARLDVGVAIFFAVAGFLLFRPYLAEYVDGLSAPGFGRYLFRRGLRVLPAYWVALTIFAIAGLVALDSRAWEQYGLVQVYDRAELFGGIVPAWSLATEVAFYLALPAVVLLMRSERLAARHSRLRVAGCMAGVLWIGAIAFRLALWELGKHQSSVWFNTLPGTLDWFAVGMGLAVLSVAGARGDRPAAVRWIERHPGLCWLAALALFAFVSTSIGALGVWGQAKTTSGWLGMHVLYGLIALLVLAPAVFPARARGFVQWLLSHPILSGLGVISYGIFLYNGPFDLWLSRSQFSGLWVGKPFLGILLGTLVLTIPAAAVSYRLLERPLLAFKDWRPTLGQVPVRSAPEDGEHSAR